MKNKKFIPLLFLSSLLVACGPSEDQYEDFDVTPYVDTLPEEYSKGNTLHAFCWTFKQIKENLPGIADAGFKNILTMPVQQPKSGGAQWWSFYQPLSFSFAVNSTIGTKQEFIELCEEADNYNIGIIVDLVCNHMANIDDDTKDEQGYPIVNPLVEEYEPILYQNRNSEVNAGKGITFHHNKNAAGSGAETQFYQYGNLPDLNTANPYVQERCLSLMKECIDAGADGFRFDTAKHIESPDDPNFASNFWPNTLGVAKEYYHTKTGKELFAYGEILGSPMGRSVDCYTPYMNITDDGYVGALTPVVTYKNVERIVNASFGKACDSSNLIGWAESHDTYCDASKTNTIPIIINRYWSIISSRKNYKGLYLARPNAELNVGIIGSYEFENEAVAVANRFHNRFLNADEFLSSDGSCFVNERISSTDKGALVLNVAVTRTPTEKTKVTLPHFEDGNYYDMLSGNKVVVTNHQANILFTLDGFVFLVQDHTSPYPRMSISEREGSFIGNKSIEVTPSFVTEAYYTYNNETTKHNLVADSKNSINLDQHLVDKVVKVNVTLKNGNHEINRTFTYQQASLIEGGFNILNINPSYFTDYEIYMWSWSPGVWSKNYTIQNGIILVDTSSISEGFLLGLFPKGYVITKVNAWDNSCLKQTTDIKKSMFAQGFYDASKF